MRSSFNHCEFSTVFRLPTTKSVVTMSLPFMLLATEMTGCVCTPFGEFHRLELRLTVRLLEALTETSTLPRPTLLSAFRGDSTSSDWKKDKAEAQLATGAVHAFEKKAAFDGTTNTGKLRTCWS